MKKFSLPSAFFILTITFLLFPFLKLSFAKETSVINIYTWSDIIPEDVIHDFEKETGIKVNYATYDSNEIMYAKLKANKVAAYDIIEPSSYYVDRMRKQNMLEKLNKNKLSLFHNINPEFLNPLYDPQSEYSIPLIWGTTGIFVNDRYYSEKNITKWTDFWETRFKNQLMLLDDPREVFSMALLALGYSVNDNNPNHIKEAFLKLKSLIPNVKIFNSDAILSVMVDEDCSLGMVWNGDLYKAQTENPHLRFIFPKEGFVLWVDTFAIPKNAPHLDNAYTFLNFILRADIAKRIVLFNNYPTANLAAQKLLPENIRTNPIIYPTSDIVKKGQYQTDLSDDALALYQDYWNQLKMNG